MQKKAISMLLAAAMTLTPAIPAAAQEPFQVYFVRSGQTLLDETGRIQGWADAPLSAAGVETIQYAAAGMKDITFDYVFTSDRIRDIEAAGIIMEANSQSSSPEMITLTQLREPNFGALEGELHDPAWQQIAAKLGVENKTAVFTMEKPVEQIAGALYQPDSVYGVEAYSAIRGRYQDALAQITQRGRTGNTTNILVVADELAINDIAGSVSSNAYRELPHGSLTQLVYSGGSYQLVASGDSKFIEAGRNPQSGSMQSSTGARVEIYLIRHGKTIFNDMSRVQGWTDTPLTAEGRQVAEDVGRGLADINFKTVYTSDLGRTVETAQLVMKHNQTSSGLPINRVAELRETNYGSFDGGWNEDMNQVSYDKYNVSTWEELSALEHATRKILTAVSEADETGQAESYETMSARVSDAFIRIAEHESANGGGNILIVSHGHAIMGILDRVCGVDIGSISNSSVSKIVYENGTFTAETVNDKSFAEKGKLR